MNIDELDLKINVDTEQLDDAIDKAYDLSNAVNRIIPNVIVKHNKNVHVTINNWNRKDEDNE